MSEWVNENAVAIAPESVGHRHRNLRSRSDGLLEEGIHVLDVEVQRDGRAVQRLLLSHNPPSTQRDFRRVFGSLLMSISLLVDYESIHPQSRKGPSVGAPLIATRWPLSRVLKVMKQAPRPR